ncbi:MAG: ABC transporter permease subunit [Propionibacteriaceae bacterium]|nr:ABC transporter permease subunit [Propionibacteriaceae bacterium]
MTRRLPPVVVPLLLPFVVVALGVGGLLVTPQGFGMIAEVGLNQAMLLGNTVLYGALTATSTTLLGWLVAHVLHVYVVPGRRVLHVLALAPLLMPSVTFAMALVMLFGNSGLVVRAFGLSGGGIYGLAGLVLAGTWARLPLAYLAVAAAYRALDVRVAEAAADLGASPWRIVRSVWLPRLWPTLVATACVVMADTVADLAVPLVLGGDFGTLAGRLYQAASGEGDLVRAAAYAVWLLPMGLVLMPLARRVARRPAAPGAPRNVARGRCTGRGALLVALAWMAVAFSALLLASVAAGSVMTAVGVDGRLTLAHFVDVLAGTQTRALATSLLVALLVTPAVMGLASLIAVGPLFRPPTVTRRLLQTAASLPGVVVGLGAYGMLAQAGLGAGGGASSGVVFTLGSVGVVALVHLMRFGPAATVPLLRTAETTAGAVRDTAHVLGARRRDVARALLWPRLRPEFVRGTVTMFARSLTAISSVVLLTNAQAPLLSVRMLVEVDAGRLSAAAAMNVTLAALVGATALAGVLLSPPQRRMG